MSNDETALRINWYLPINSRMNAPDMPGRIIAQMAIAPDSRMNHHVSGVCDGDATVIHHATAMPHNSETTDAAFKRVTSRATNSAEATISPKKKAQISMGWCSNR